MNKILRNLTGKIDLDNAYGHNQVLVHIILLRLQKHQNLIRDFFIQDFQANKVTTV